MPQVQTLELPPAACGGPNMQLENLGSLLCSWGKLWLRSLLFLTRLICNLNAYS